jgi:molecular chaperone DnaK
VPQIEVTFDIDANGILHVSAKDTRRATEKMVRNRKSASNPPSGLSEAEIERMVRDAEANADQDRKLKEKVEAKNEADSEI